MEIITIGTELLLGFGIDSNAVYLGKVLAEFGIPLTRRTTVADDVEAIKAAVGEALTRTGMVITTGGLGPTSDDVTVTAVAAMANAGLHFDDEVWKAITERYTSRGLQPADPNRSQAMIPDGAEVLPNRWGTAPGLWFDTGNGVVIALPGVPREMRNLFEQEVVPRLHAGATVIRSATLRTNGVAESALAERIGTLGEQLPPLTLAYLPGFTGVDLRLTAWGMEPDVAGELLARGISRLRDAVGPCVYGEGDVDIAALVIDELRARNWKIAVAESCTGGLLGARITAVPGASDVFVGGVIAYDNAVKVGDLGVASDVLDEHGAVSAEAARAMASGIASRMHAPVTISLTGIAGPSGGSDNKPVGTVFVAWSIAGEVEAKRVIFPGDRDEIRARAAQTALVELWRRIVDRHPV
ncbi:MAG: competence/damage-inducible protein A [Gemmatimonadales bacterium]